MKKKNQFGFTLIELLVVISIIGLLSTLAVVSLGTARQKARDAKVKSDIKNISTAMELYAANDLSGAYYGTTNATCANATNPIAKGASGSVVCEGNPIKDANDIYLQAIPTAPVTTYLYTGNTSGYCFSGALENPTTNVFKCTTGGVCAEVAVAQACS